MKVTVVYCDDWQGYYFDGVLVSEDETPNTGEILEKLLEFGRPITSIDSIEVANEWMYEIGNLPQSINEVVPL